MLTRPDTARLRLAGRPAAIPALLALALALPGALAADTVHLENGARIDGVIDAAASSETEYVVRIGEAGLVRLARDRVASIEKNDRNGGRDGGRDGGEEAARSGEAAPVRAIARPLVKVRLKKNPLYGDGGILYGVQSPESNDETVVLETPGAGTIRIARAAIERIQPYREVSGGTPLPAAASSGAVSIPTTHRITMKNGRVLLGNVLDDAAATGRRGDVVVEIAGLGRLTINRRWIEKIEAAPGKIVIPPEPPAAPAGEETAPPAETSRPPAPPRAEETPAVSEELEHEILFLVRELTRQRTRNRTRAENRLRRIGAAAIPYLADVAHHPFNLTRRAVMRLVRDARDPAGVPLALDGLLDEDVWVRTHASEALRAITHRNLGYNPRAPLRARLRAWERWLDALHGIGEVTVAG